MSNLGQIQLLLYTEMVKILGLLGNLGSKVNDLATLSDAFYVTDYLASFLKVLTPGFALFLGFFHQVQEKVDHVRLIDEKYAQVVLENAELKKQMESLKFVNETKRVALETQMISQELMHKTGMRTGRTIASFNYRIPVELSSSQLYTLALSYLVTNEDEKAAQILTSLMSLDEGFRTPKNYLISGVLWYRLDNLEQAEHNFDFALKSHSSEKTGSKACVWGAPQCSTIDSERSSPNQDETLAQARLWKAVLAQRRSHTDQVQFWMSDLLNHHPSSIEASWINPYGNQP